MVRKYKKKVKWKGVSKLPWKGSKYARYSRPRDPTSKIQYVGKYDKVPYKHGYGAPKKKGISKQLFGEPRTKKELARLKPKYKKYIK